MSIVMDNCCVCEEPVGCSIIQVEAVATNWGFSANRRSARTLAGSVASDVLSGPDLDAWIYFVDNVFPLSTIHPSLPLIITGPIAMGTLNGSLPGCPIGRKFQTFIQSYTGAIFYDLGLGDGQNWYSATHDFLYRVDVETGILIVFDYVNTCGQNYHWALDLVSGDVTSSGTQKTVFEAGGTLSDDCPLSGYGMFFPYVSPGGHGAPRDVIVGAGGYSIASTDYESNPTGWEISYDVYVSYSDGIHSGDVHTTMIESAAANFQNDDAEAGYTWDVARVRARTMADFVNLADVNHVYPVEEGIYDPDGNYVGGQVKQGKSYRVEYSTTYALLRGAPLYGAGFSYQFGDMYIYPQRLVIFEVGDVTDAGHAGIEFLDCDEVIRCSRFRVGVLGDNYATMTHVTPPIESSLAAGESPGGDPSTDGQCATTEADTDCLHPFRATGNHIVEPEDSTFENGRLTMSLMVYPHLDEDGNKVCTYDTEIIEGVPTPTWPPTAPC